jgi:DeoR/GlpR family transcriptional regulator of sugar metabolism
MKKSERNRIILERLEHDGHLQISDLARDTKVSEMTIRRDLEGLEAIGALVRVHGGAVPALSRSLSPQFHTRSLRNENEKALIGAAAAAQIRDGETVIIDAGSTTLHVARALAGRSNLRVLALDLRVADCLADEPGMVVTVVGGTVRPVERSIYGSAAERSLAGLNYDTFIMSAGGVDATAGITEFNPDDASVKQAALASARRTVVVADHTKLGVVTFAHVCALDKVDMVITDAAGANSPTLSEAADGGVQIVTAA